VWRRYAPSLAALAAVLMLCLRPLLLETQLQWQASVAAIPLRDVGGDTAIREKAMHGWLAELEKSARAVFPEAGVPKGVSLKAHLEDLVDGSLVLQVTVGLGAESREMEKSFAGPADAAAALAQAPVIARELASLAGTLTQGKTP
jgi:hypothetical protein